MTRLPYANYKRARRDQFQPKAPATIPVAVPAKVPAWRKLWARIAMWLMRLRP